VDLPEDLLSYVYGEKVIKERKPWHPIFIRLHHLAFQKVAVVVTAVRSLNSSFKILNREMRRHVK
jgi:hypothetical protein